MRTVHVHLSVLFNAFLWAQFVESGFPILSYMYVYVEHDIHVVHVITYMYTYTQVHTHMHVDIHVHVHVHVNKSKRQKKAFKVESYFQRKRLTRPEQDLNP